jgi:LmbE family N-acetylglucosaminyl deacetylase
VSADPSTMLVVVAHPDDETFGTGSVIAAAAERGVQVTVCCATRGEAGEAHKLDAGADLGVVREQELRAAGAELGVHDFVLLGYGDSGMSGNPAPGTLCAADLADVVAEVGDVVSKVSPTLVVTLDPDHGDGHRDHAVIARATIEACRHRRGLQVYGWAVPRGLLARWFAEIQDLRPDSAHLELDRQGLGRPEEMITTALDTKHLRAVRERAIALHRSQTSPFDGMPEDLRNEFLDTDYLVRLVPPWDGGTREHSLF